METITILSVRNYRSQRLENTEHKNSNLEYYLCNIFYIEFFKPFNPSTADNIVAHTINIVKIGQVRLFGISNYPHN